MHLRTHRCWHYATGITPQEPVNLMAPGWKLGNSVDAIPNETSWGNSTPSQSLIKAVGEYGGRSSGGIVLIHAGKGPPSGGCLPGPIRFDGRSGGPVVRIRPCESIYLSS
jgi:hypothetical protein